MTKKLVAKKNVKSSKVKVGGASRIAQTPLYAKLLFVLLIAVVGGYTISRSFAASSSLYLNPATSAVTAGSSLTLSVRFNPVGGNSDGVQATVTFDPAKLQFVSADYTGSAFPVQLQQSATANTVTIVRALDVNAPAVTTDSLVANLTFKALDVAASSSVTISGNATDVGNYLDPTTAGSTVAIGAAPTTTPKTAADTVAPQVSITSPANGSKLGGRTTISASATDNVKVAKVELSIDGSIVQSSTTNSLRYSWNLKSSRVQKGSHSIVVKAYDAAGNIGSSAVTANY